MTEQFFSYKESEGLSFTVNKKTFLTILGDKNKTIVDNIMFKNKNNYMTINYIKINEKQVNKLRQNINFVSNEHLNVFVGETVKDEIAYGMENQGVSKQNMMEFISKKSVLYKIEDLLDKDPYSLGASDKVKVKIVSTLAYNPKILVLYEIFSELDLIDKRIVTKLLKEYVDEGNIVINFTSDVNETLYGDKIIIINKDKVVIEGNTLSVLNEDRLLKRLGIGLPFIVDLNKYLMDYGLINKYELDMERLVDKLWK